jgi:hypothetical protein
MTFPKIINASFFNTILEERQKKTQSILSKKAEEYASDTDRLHNFKSAAQFDDETPEKALWGMWKKHLVSIQDIINKIEHGHQHGIIYEITEEEWKVVNEKITDTVNYCILLEGLLYARRSIHKEKEKNNSPVSKS